MKKNSTRSTAGIARPWGILACIDLYDCDPTKIRSKEQIKRFVIELCELIKMNRFGETRVVHFGKEDRVAGYSMVQLIETSLLSAHFANLSNTAYLDVFSCKVYDPEKVRDFAKGFFKAEKVHLQVLRRE